MQRPVVVLPQPLSPTSPRTSPRSTENETPSTAFTWPTVLESKPSLIGNRFFNPSTCSSGSGTRRPCRGRQCTGRVDATGRDLLGAPAARQVAPAEVEHGRVFGSALVDGDRTARMEAASAR